MGKVKLRDAHYCLISERGSQDLKPGVFEPQILILSTGVCCLWREAVGGARPWVGLRGARARVKSARSGFLDDPLVLRCAR